MATTLDIQRALKAAGFDPGPVDGIQGRMTTGAVKRFQESKGLDVDGIVGPRTIAALFPVKAGQSPQTMPLPWMETAKDLLGVKERPGSASNPVILEWADDLDIHYSGDDVAWCGLFVAHCIGSTLPDEVLPTNPLGARNWLTAGVKCDPQFGATMVFWRGSRAGWQGHVGFYVGERKDAYRIRGGNQSNSVSDAWIAKNRLLGARWPKTVPFLLTGRTTVADGSALSTNEA